MTLNICQNLIVTTLNEILCVYIPPTQIWVPGGSFMNSLHVDLVEVKSDFLYTVPENKVLLADRMAGSEALVLS